MLFLAQLSGPAWVTVLWHTSLGLRWLLCHLPLTSYRQTCVFINSEPITEPVSSNSSRMVGQRILRKEKEDPSELCPRMFVSRKHVLESSKLHGLQDRIQSQNETASNSDFSILGGNSLLPHSVLSSVRTIHLPRTWRPHNKSVLTGLLLTTAVSYPLRQLKIQDGPWENSAPQWWDSTGKGEWPHSSEEVFPVPTLSLHILPHHLPLSQPQRDNLIYERNPNNYGCK